MRANPESRNKFSNCIWIPGPALSARHGMTLREQGDLLKAHGFRPAHDEIHILDGLAGGPFHQIVQRGDDDGTAGTRSLATPINVIFEPRTCRVCGVSPNGNTWTNGSFKYDFKSIA